MLHSVGSSMWMNSWRKLCKGEHCWQDCFTKCERCNTSSHLSVSTVQRPSLALVTLVSWGLLSPGCMLLGLRGHAGLAAVVSTWKRAWLLKCIFSPEKKPEFEDKSRSSKPHTRTKTFIFSFSSPFVSSCTHLLISQKAKFVFPSKEM